MSVVNKFFMKGNQLVYTYELIEPTTTNIMYSTASLGFITYMRYLTTQRISISRYAYGRTDLNWLNYKGWVEIPADLIDADSYEMMYQAVEKEKGKKFKAILKLLQHPDEFRILHKPREINVSYDTNDGGWYFQTNASGRV